MSMAKLSVWRAGSTGVALPRSLSSGSSQGVQDWAVLLPSKGVTCCSSSSGHPEARHAQFLLTRKTNAFMLLWLLGSARVYRFLFCFVFP